MATYDIQPEFIGFSELEKAILNFKKSVTGIKNNKKFIDNISSTIIFKDVMDHFKNQEGSDGPWKVWSKIYAERQKGRGRSKILQDTGRLRNAFTPGNYRVKSDGVEWFNAAKTKSGFPYAAAHDEGGERLPKREFMWLSDKRLEEISNITAVWMGDEFGK